MTWESSYIKCPECEKIILDTEQKFIWIAEPMPCCGASGRARITWPFLEAQEFLKIISDQDLKTENGIRIAVVFLCTVLELLLEEILWLVICKHTNSKPLANHLLESNQGKDRRIGLFNKLSNCSFKDLLKKHNKESFMKNWDALCKLRNNLIHGRYYTEIEKEQDLIKIVIDDSLVVFFSAINKVLEMHLEEQES